MRSDWIPLYLGAAYPPFSTGLSVATPEGGTPRMLAILALRAVRAHLTSPSDALNHPQGDEQGPGAAIRDGGLQPPQGHRQRLESAISAGDRQCLALDYGDRPGPLRLPPIVLPPLISHLALHSGAGCSARWRTRTLSSSATRA